MTILKKLLFGAAVVIFVVIVAIFMLGAFVSGDRSFTNEITIDAPADKVWQVINDKEKYLEWQTQLEKVEVIDNANWIEYPKTSPEPLKFRLVEDARPTRMEFAYTMGDSIQGYWKGEVTPTATGVRLKTVDGYKTDSGLMKLMMRAFFDLDSFAKDWNSKLKARVEALDR